MTALHVPGHTPADMAYLVHGAVFVGDTLFMPDLGSARTDFPGGDARQLYRSIRRLLALPPETVMYICHDDPPPHRAAADDGGEQRAANVHAKDGVSEADFVAMRVARDATLAVPKLLLSRSGSTCVSACRRPTRRHALPSHSAPRAPRCSVRPRRRFA